VTLARGLELARGVARYDVKEPAIMVREPDATMQPTLQDDQLMSKHRVLGFKPQLRLEWRGQDGHHETEQLDHSASDSVTSSTRIREVNLGVLAPPLRPPDLVRCTSGLHDDPLFGRTEWLGELGQRGLDQPRFEDHPCGLAVGIKFIGHSQRYQCICDAPGVNNHAGDGADRLLWATWRRFEPSSSPSATEAY
jgi:hypothetical protein